VVDDISHEGLRMLLREEGVSFQRLKTFPIPAGSGPSAAGSTRTPSANPGPRIRATYNRYGGVRHLLAAYDLAKDKLYGHIKPTKNHTKFLEFCRYLRGLYPARVRIAIVCDNFSRT
jgi:hypothetical protein